jgi:Do/DeqQ family serine protease
VTPAVVNIATVTQIAVEQHPLLSDPFFRRFFDLPRERRERRGQSLGSGVIVDADAGLVLTNHHVVDKATEIEVTLHDGRKLRAELVGTDAETDVAVLRIPAEGLTAVGLGDSDEIEVGDFVVAIGSPFGLSQTVTSGIVSALARSGLGIEGYESFIQTDASINPGNSGGPLVDLRGRLVGINTAILAPGGGNVGIGFAIPVNMARAVLEQIVAYGAVRRGLFGIGVQDLTPELAQALGTDIPRAAVVASVEPGSAAAAAGLAPGDVVTAIDGRPVTSAADLRNRIGLLPIGTPLELRIIRQGKPITLRGTVADPYARYRDGGAIDPSLAGALLGDLAKETRAGRVLAVAVGTVTPGSPAWQSGLREGDILLEINGSRVRDLKALAAVVARDRGIVRLRLQRGERIMALVRR